MINNYWCSNPAHLVAEKVHVVVIDKQGRTALGANLFEIRASDVCYYNNFNYFFKNNR